MNAMNTRQLPLHLPLEPGLGRDDVIVSDANRLAVALVDGWRDWPGRLALLVGPAGSGKTHLARLWAADAKATVVRLPELESFAKPANGNLVIEDVEPGGFDEAQWFHWLNHVRSQAAWCLVTSRFWPAEWNVTLPDLASRLRAAHLVELREPDDAMLRQVIVKLFADRQLTVEPGVIAYLSARMERSLEAANALVAAMDREALAARRPITRNVAARALAELGMA